MTALAGSTFAVPHRLLLTPAEGEDDNADNASLMSLEGEEDITDITFSVGSNDDDEDI